MEIDMAITAKNCQTQLFYGHYIGIRESPVQLLWFIITSKLVYCYLLSKTKSSKWYRFDTPVVQREVLSAVQSHVWNKLHDEWWCLFRSHNFISSVALLTRCAALLKLYISPSCRKPSLAYGGKAFFLNNVSVGLKTQRLRHTTWLGSRYCHWWASFTIFTPLGSQVQGPRLFAQWSSNPLHWK